MSTLQLIRLIEYEPVRLPRTDVRPEDALELWRQYGGRVSVDPPSFKNDYHWELESRGWVGYIRVSGDVSLLLLPRAKIANLFRMLEYAYNLGSFHLLDGLFECESISDVYERLASVLAHRVLERSRKGFYRAYITREERLQYLSGRLDVQSMLRAPCKIDLPCCYENHTADVRENRLLAWTLLVIARCAACGPSALALTRTAFRSLQGCVHLESFSAEDCLDCSYSRLNDDYEPMHALCRFFLENSGPCLTLGDHRMLPFLVDMARLYEAFVARWLKENLPADLKLDPQERVHVDPDGYLKFVIDLVIRDSATGTVLCVMDTKYKPGAGVSVSDVEQVVAYAVSLQSTLAVLLYPVSPACPDALANVVVGGIRVRSLTFALDGDLDATGDRLKAELVSLLRNEATLRALERQAVE